MLVNGDEIISRQLSLTQPSEMSFADGSKTALTPARTVPRLDGEARRLDLDGEWEVMRWPFKRKEATLVSPRTRSASWEKVRQPGRVFLYDPDETASRTPNYDRVKLTHLDPQDGAVLRRTARIPEAWQRKRIYLRFDAIYPAGRIYLDGCLLGEHLSGLTPVEFDVTERVRPGEPAVVAVRLLRRHEFVQLDMPRHSLEYGGLCQSACVHATEPLQVQDYHLKTTLDRSLKEGELEGTIDLKNHTNREQSCVLTLTLAGPDARRTRALTRKLKVGPGANKAVRVKLRSKEVLLWNDEAPHLYTVTMELKARGQATQETSFRTGFRRLDLSPKGAFLNGRPVKFRGVNHLTFHPEHGMYTPKEWLRRNLELMKKANVNAIRTHFLGPPALAELCDEMGIYLLQELPIDWGTRFIHNPRWMGPILMRLEGSVRRDRHHPSVMVWSVGNENMPETKEVADDGWNHLRICDRFVKGLDPTRPTMFPPPGPAGKVEAILELRVGDIADTHYSFRLIEKFAKTGRAKNPRAWDGTMEVTTREEALRRGWKGVWFSSEYGIFNMQPDLLNAPYLSRIADVEEELLSGKNSLQVFLDRMRREWGLMRDDSTCLGGAYFPWLCSGAGKGENGNPWGWVRWGEDADWGPVTADLLPKPFFWALRVLFSPVRIRPERVLWRKGEKKLEVELWNQYNSIDLKDCTFRTMMGGGGKWMGGLSDFRDVPVRAKPGQKTKVKIPIWNRASLASLEQGSPICLRCIVIDPRGFRPLTTDLLVIPE